MDRSEIENVSPEVEMLAKMWIKCDPNREDNADEPATLYMDGQAEQHPRWKWFIPRARASLAFFEAGGFTVSKASPSGAETPNG